MKERIETVNNRSRSEMYLDSERMVEREVHLGGSRRLGVDERRVGFNLVSENGVDRQLGHVRKGNANDQGVFVRGIDTASKFQWTSLLRGSGGSGGGDGVERGFRDSGSVGYGRRYDGLVEGSVLVDREADRNVSNYSRNVGGDEVEYRGVNRNVTGVRVPVVEPKYLGHVRNVTDLQAEDRRNSRNMTGLPVEDAEYRRIVRAAHPVEVADYQKHTRNVTDLHAEDHRNSRNMTGLPVKDAEYRRILRNAHLVEGAEYQRHTRNVTGHPVDYGERFLVREYPRDVNRQSDMKSYEDGNCIRYRSEDNSRSLTPRSQTSDQHTPYRGIPSTNMQGSRSHQDVSHHPSDALGTDGSVPASSYCGSHRLVCSKADTNACPVPSMGITSRRTDYNQTLGRHSRYIHPDDQVSGKVYEKVLSKNNFDTYENVAYYDDRGDVSENHALNPPLSRFNYIGSSPEYQPEEDGQLHNSDRTLQQVPMVDLNVMSKTFHEMDYDGVGLESMSEHLEYRPDAGHETLPYEEDYPSEFVAYGVSHENQRWNNEMLERGANLDENLQQNLESEYADFYTEPRRPKRKREFVEKINWPKHRPSTLGGRGALSNGSMHFPSENELIRPSKRSSHHVHSKVNARMTKTEPRQPFGGLSKELQSRLSKPLESGSNDIKSRLKFPRFVPRLHGPQASKLMKGNVYSCNEPSLDINQSPSITHPYVKAKPKSVKKGHKSTPHEDVFQPETRVSHTGLYLEPQQKLAARSSGITKETGPLLELDSDHSILKVKPTEKDPPEKSEELKRQVDYWYLKCLIYLNANPGRLKKFKGLGNAGTLKCIICSSAKEFTQTKDVATHAFSSLKVGFRAPHLGFHRALCFLQGLDPEVATNGRWVCKSLPEVEAQALKEEIILWPPVFVIQCGSARDFYGNEQVKVSIEQLENILRDMGLTDGKASVCYGKPGNPNIMLVKFSGTLSGFLEAERLHNLFAEKKHGKTELLEMAASGGSGKEVDEEPEDKVEDILYGYLGIVEDFDKLNFDMRQRYVAKSKKEILALVDNAV